MKQLKLYLALVALSFGLGFSQEGFAADKKEIYKKQTGILVYSIQNIQNGLVPKDIDRLDTEAGGYLSVQLAAEIAERLDASLDLIRTIKNDKDLNEKERGELIDTLGSELGALFMTSVRQHGDDELDPRKSKNRVFSQYAAKASKELVNTFVDLVQFPKTDEGTRTWKVKERMLREYITQDAVIKFQKLMHEMGQNSKDPDYKAMRFLLQVPDDKKEDSYDFGLAEKALLVRENRLSAYRTVLGTIGFGAMLWTLFPVDWPGMFVGYDLVTPRIADFITYSSFTLLALIRRATGAFGTIPGIKRLIEIMNKPEAPHEFSTLKLPLFAKIMRIETKVNRARQAFRGNRCDLF